MAEATSKVRQTAYHANSYGSYDGITADVPDVPQSYSRVQTQFINSSVTSGVQNPYWQQQVKQGSNATTPFQGDEYSFSATPASAELTHTFVDKNFNPPKNYKRHYVAKGKLVYSPLPSIPSVGSDVSTRVTNRCIQRFLSQANSVLSSIEGGQDIGEYRETLRTIRRPLGSMQDKLSSYVARLTKAKRRYRGSVPSLRKVLADTYLEFRFGINPLVSDVAQLIADAGRHRFDYYPVSATAGETYQGGDSIVSAGFPGGTNGPLNAQQQRTSYSRYSVKYFGMIKTSADASGQIGYAQSLRLLPKDWLPTAWDLLPYSWIIDYFTNIGDIIEGLCFLQSNIAWGYKNTRLVGEAKWSDVSMVQTYPPDGGGVFTTSFTYHSGGGSAVFKAKRMTRSVLVGSDLIPRFEFRIPKSPYPYLNLAALAISRAKRIVPFF